MAAEEDESLKKKGNGTKSFITEVDNSPSTAKKSLRDAIALTLSGSSKDDGGDVRPGERASRFSPVKGKATGRASGGGGEVFRVIDNMGEKQQRSKNIRSMIQKAAQKTILVVRAKNATQAAENVTVRFNKNRVTDTPRSVQLRHVCDKVLRHVHYSSKKKKLQYQEIFASAAEVDALLKDMFWYLTAHYFQSNKHLQLEQSFYERIADNFTSLFIRLQMQPQSRDSGFFDMLPDVIAQILFMALYEAFPKSRKNMMNGELRRKILHTCHCWILGFVPADLSWSHWIAVDQESPKRIAALADFPAMRNRMLRAERVERTKLEVKNRHGSSVVNDSAMDDLDDMRDELHPEARDASEDEKLPRLPQGHSTAGKSNTSAHPVHVQTRERCVYQMRNSPLVDAFLKRHQLEANASHLKVQLRMTNGKHFDLKNQEALHETSLPRGRRRRIVDPNAYTEVLGQIESFGDSVRQAYASEKKQMRDRDAAEKKQLLAAQRELEAQLGDMKQHGVKMHEYSNLLVSKGRIDAIMPPKERSARSGGGQPSAAGASSAGPTAPATFTPRPPPPRQAATRQ